jgi:hypothetical protein
LSGNEAISHAGWTAIVEALRHNRTLVELNARKCNVDEEQQKDYLKRNASSARTTDWPADFSSPAEQRAGLSPQPIDWRPTVAEPHPAEPLANVPAAAASSLVLAPVSVDDSLSVTVSQPVSPIPSPKAVGGIEQAAVSEPCVPTEAEVQSMAAAAADRKSSPDGDGDPMFTEPCVPNAAETQSMDAATAIRNCSAGEDPAFTEPCVPTAAELQSMAAAAAARKRNDDDDPLFTESCGQSQHTRSNKPAASLDGRGLEEEASPFKTVTSFVTTTAAAVSASAATHVASVVQESSGRSAAELRSMDHLARMRSAASCAGLDAATEAELLVRRLAELKNADAASKPVGMATAL